MLSESQHNRYQRHLILKDFGEQGQEKLAAAKVLVIGAGALASPALQYLTAAGVSCIGIVDFDKIELSNLQRQVLYDTDDVGKLKAEIAAKKLQKLNPEIEFRVFPFRFNSKNAKQIVQEFDVVIDATDNFATRYLINDVCCFLNIPFVYGAILEYEGQMAVFNLEDPVTKIKTTYRDFYPLTSANTNSPNCSDVGVLGVLPGIIGTLQATEVIKIITGIGSVMINQVLMYQALTSSFNTYQLSAHSKSTLNAPTSLEEMMQMDYEVICNAISSNEINLREFDELRKNRNCLLVDVREIGELPELTEMEHMQLPLSKLEEGINGFKRYDKIIFVCASGQRSQTAVNRLIKLFPQNSLYSLKGGIKSLKNRMKTKVNG